jgi:hypothetical protein
MSGDLVATKRACTQAATERNEALRMERATKQRVIPIQVVSLGCFETNDTNRIPLWGATPVL